MPLPMPRLDNRTFDQLFSEGLSLIQRHAKEWIDHNIHDPGITLVDLFAWLVEMDVYRLDRISEASYRTFLRLLGTEPRPAQVAETIVIFNPTQSGSSVQLPADSKVTNNAGNIIFQTVDKLYVSQAKLRVVLTGSEDALINRTAENQIPSKYYHPFGSEPKLGHALYLGSDQPLADAPTEVSFYVWVGKGGVDKVMRERLKAEWEDVQTEVKRLCPFSTGLELLDWRKHYSARTIWEYYAKPGMWTPLSGVTDETRGLTMSGFVRFTTPRKDQHLNGGVKLPSHGGHYFIRCRLEGGRYECPPVIDMVAFNTVLAQHASDIDKEEKLGVSTGCAKQVFQAKNKPVVPGSTRLRTGEKRQEKMTSHGKPSQVFYVQHPPGVERTQVITVAGTRWTEIPDLKTAAPDEIVYQFDARRGVIYFGDGIYGRIPPYGAPIVVTYEPRWQEVLVWDRVGPHDRTYVLSPETGEICFGDGRVGRVPPAGAEIFITYKAGGGISGNVAAHSLVKVLGTYPVEATQPYKAIGGALPESLAEAKGRAMTLLTKPCRAVTLADFEAIALDIPGIPVARAHAIADYDPAMPCLPALGSVTLVIVPHCPDTRPEPGPDMLQAVARYLERRRTITTELHAIGPGYTSVAVHARLHTGINTDKRKLMEQACTALDKFLHPLHGGPDSTGWPVGRDVYRSEVMALLNSLPGVTYVDDVVLQVEDGLEAHCGNISICPHGLVASGKHKITVVE